MKNKSDGHFIQHCEMDSCTLGTFEYNCPCCKKYIVDYDMWWNQDESYDNGVDFECEKCKKPLSVKYDKDECEFVIIFDGDEE